ncbi:MAG: CGNR zinc finger domain-containing protein [Solirubrobacteraceae bacterium]|nr:CGNR zinc finger domain-containing protein [Solirubrobacteraceae bacterium]
MSNPAPGTLETVRAFVNTRDVDDDIDLLSGPAELASWLADAGLAAAAGENARELRATGADLRRAIELREALRAHLLAHHDQPLDPQAAATLDATARRARLTVRFTGRDETALEPEAGGVDGALGRLLAIVARAIEDGTWQRLKVCPADTCQWAFYDASRNRSAVWCDMRVCGNRAKVRGFRERTRSGDPGGQDATHGHGHGD